MRKILGFILVILVLLVSLPALATSFTFNGVNLSIEIPDTYLIITPETAEANSQFLLSKGMNAGEVGSIFEQEGILLQAWNKTGDVCFELTAKADEDGVRYYDIDQQTPATRGTYRKAHLNGEKAHDTNVKYSSAEWKLTEQYGRVLRLKYSQKNDEKAIIKRGYARKTIKNGYTILFDMQVYDRKLKASDSKALDTIMKSVYYNISGDVAVSSAGQMIFEEIPPVETNTGSFEISGKGKEGMAVTATLVRMTESTATTLTATTNKKGNFTMPVRLPQEGVYMMTLIVEMNGTILDEIAYPAITYKTSLLPVNITQGVPEKITSEKLTIEGTSIKGAKVQLLYNSKNKTVSVGSGKTFSFSVDTSEEGIYNFTLVVSKKGMDTRRFEFSGIREYTEAENRDLIKKEAVKPAYKTLVAKIEGYDGRVMVYTPYVTAIEQNGPDWLITMAMTRNKNGSYKDYFVVNTSSEPNMTVGNSYKMYLRCQGMYSRLIEGGEENNLPSFELLFLD